MSTETTFLTGPEAAATGRIMRSDDPCAAAVACAHCGLDVPTGSIEPEAQHQFCCGGCRAVFETIHACGLDSYYRLREAAQAAGKPIVASHDIYTSFDSEAFHELYVTRDEGGLCGIDLVLEGVTCAACVWLIERLPRVLEGVVAARLSLRQATVRITWDRERVALSRIAQTLSRLGYRPHPAKGQTRQGIQRKEERRRLIHLGAAGAIMGNVMLLGLALYAGLSAGMEAHYKALFRWLSALLAVISLSWPGATFFTSAYRALRAKSINLDVPIALALLVGGVAGTINTITGRGEIYFDSLTVLVFLLLVGRYLQYRQQRRADGALELLFSLTPSTCHIIEHGTIVDAPVEALKPGDLVEVRSGELLPADGVVELGHSALEQALLTGESVPASVGPGDAVYGGCQNTGSVLCVRVTEVGRGTRVGKLMDLVERGVVAKPQIVQMADRVGAWFVVVVSLAAAGVLLFWSRYSTAAAIDHAVALLIVTCPCVLGLATPLTIAIAMGRLARNDILVKSGAALEKLAAAGGRLILDKTGTITEGKLRLLEWAGDKEIQPAVAALERKSNHPIGRVLASLADDQLNVTNVIELHDGGISGSVDGQLIRVGSPTYMARHNITPSPDMDQRRRVMEQSGATVVLIAAEDDGRAGCLAIAALGDVVRKDGPAAVSALAAMGWGLSVLSGDAPEAVRSAAKQIGIDPDRARGGVTPEEKLSAITSKSQSEKGIMVMVGDGVNDAAALAAADVGVAMHGGAEASLAAADVYIARPGLAPLLLLVLTSRRTMRIIRRNLGVSLAYNLLAGVIAAMGLMHPLLAAIIMPVSSATVLSLAATSISSATGGRSWK